MRTQRLIFSSTLVAALGAVACGRQVTPNPPGLGPGGAPPGYMAVIFDTAAAFNFTSYQYMVVLNTNGNGATPSTQTWQTNWDGYSFELVALGNGLSSYAQPFYLARNANPHISPQRYPLITTPQTFSYNLNNNGSGTEFELLAKVSLFNYNPSPSPSPPSKLWTFNAFVTQANPSGQWLFYDSMGAGGPIPPEYVSPVLDMTQCFDNTYFPQGQYTPTDPSGQITSVEIANNPVSPTCPPQ
jgi:hypothetical protein